LLEFLKEAGALAGLAATVEGNCVRFEEHTLPRDVLHEHPRRRPRRFSITWEPDGRLLLEKLAQGYNFNRAPQKRWRIQHGNLENGEPITILRLNKSHKGHIGFDGMCERLLGRVQRRLFTDSWLLTEDARRSFKDAVKRHATAPANADRKTAKRIQRRREAAQAAREASDVKVK
jgi:hypothetical protein